MMHKMAASLEEEHPGVRPHRADWLRTAKDILVAHGWFNQFQREHGQKELSLEAFREDPRYGYYLTEVRI